MNSVVTEKSCSKELFETVPEMDVGEEVESRYLVTAAEFILNISWDCTKSLENELWKFLCMTSLTATDFES